MKRLAIYAHYDRSKEVAGHVLFCLRQVAELGFQICFVSNSEISNASEAALKTVCERVLIRENSGLDFSMWQHGLAEYDLSEYEELLLTNSSVIGPLKLLAPLWQRPELAGCDFWGLTDNEDFTAHLSSYFLVFRQRALQSERFHQFWRSVLAYTNKWQVIFSYELGLSEWMQEGGFTWRALFPQRQIRDQYRLNLGFLGKLWDRGVFVEQLCRNREWPSQNTTLVYPDVLLESGMPFLKLSLLHQKNRRISPAVAFALLEKHGLPKEILQELREKYGKR